MSWTCSVCGQEHEGVVRDIRFGLPDPVFALDEGEREQRADVGEDWCRFRDAGNVRHYVRGLVHVPIATTREDFRFGVWIEVGEADFLRLGELWYDDDGHATPPFFGWLANELLPYPATFGLAAALQLREVAILPAVVLLGAEHPLAVAQRHGIGEADAQRLAETAVH